MKRIFALLLTAVLLSYAPAALADGEETRKSKESNHEL